MTISYMCVTVLEPGDMQKMVVSKGWCKESRKNLQCKVLIEWVSVRYSEGLIV